MNFTVPTTKEGLVQVLREIDEYYRYRKDFYEEPVIVPLDLKKIEFTSLSDEEIIAIADDIFEKKKAYEKIQKESEIAAEITELEAEKLSVGGGLTKRLADIDKAYDESVRQLEIKFAERNMSYSSAYYDSLENLEADRNAEKDEVTAEILEKQSVIDGKISAKTELKNSIDGMLTNKYDALKSEYVQERKDKQREYADSVLKYNNQIDEKVIKNQNSVNQNYSKLKIDYMSIVNKGLTTEQLDALGYYGDVITVVDGYYFSISASDAYEDFILDTKMPYYLGEYYDDILYKYKLRANK